MLYASYIYYFSFIWWGQQLDRKKKLFFSMIPFVIIAFLRFGFGADYFSYGRIFYDIDISNLNNAITRSPVEPLYTAINYVFRVLGIDYHIFSALFVIAISFITVYWLVDYSPNFPLSVLLYFSMHYSVWTLSALRQGISMAILFYVFFNTKKEFSTKFKVITVIATMLIHTSSIVVPVIYIASKINWKRRWFVYILILSPFVRLLFRPEMIVVMEKIPVIKNFVSYLVDDPIKLLSYTSLVRLLFFSVTLVHYNNLKEKYPDYVTLFNFVLLSFLLYFFIPFSRVIATRVTVYGYFLTILVFPMIVSLYEKTKLRLVMVAGLLSFSLLSFYNEFDKMRDRSGYIYSLTQLNTETIFSKNYKNFDRQFSVHYQLGEEDRERLKHLSIIDRVTSEELQVESEYDPDLSHISVYFPNSSMYGIVNEKGMIVEMDSYGSRFRVYNGFVEHTVSKPQSYNHYRFRKINKTKYLDFEESLQISNSIDSIEFERRYTEIYKSPVSLKTLDSIEFLSEYNLGSVTNAYHHLDTFNDDFKYLQISTSYSNYYALMNADGTFLVDKLYGRIEPLNINNIFIGYTDYTREYINTDGEIIWIELLK